ncbi:MAG: hypothetical protein WKF90_02825 [Pyrinomonadaceae bacterium]
MKHKTMKHNTSIIFVTALLMIFSVSAFAANSDLSGVWALDKAKSDGSSPEMNQIMTIKQTGENLSLETKIIMGGNENVFSRAYKLDGKEAEYAVNTTVSTNTNSEEGDETVETTKKIKGKQTAKWTADGVEILELTNSINGTGTVKIARKLTLSADGKTLTVNIKVESPTVKSETKLTFNKK